MPFEPDRLRNLREAKGLSQQQLAKLAGMSQSVIAKSERGGNLPGSEVLDKLAQGLDCTIDYLHDRGPHYGSPSAAASHMALDVAQRSFTDEQREKCRRVLPHPDAPKTADAWRSFAEMFTMASGSKSTRRPLVLVDEPMPATKPMGVARHQRNRKLIP